MKNLIYTVFAVIVLILFAFPVNAQVTEGEEEENVIINRTVTTTSITEIMVNDANKISVNPKPTDTVYAAPSFDYTIRELKMSTPFKVVPIKAAKMKGQPLEKLYPNYVAVGMGTRATPYAEFFHSKTRSRYLNYGVHGRHFSSAADITDFAYPGYSDNLFEGYMSRFGKANAFSSVVSYEREAIHYYGYEPALVDTTLQLLSDDANKQIFHTAKASFNWYRYKPKRKDMDFNIGGDYTFFADRDMNMQHTVFVNGHADWYVSIVKGFDKQRLGFKFDNLLHVNTFDSIGSNHSDIIGIAPYYKFEANILKAEIGFKANITTDTIEDITFEPDIHLEVEGIKDILYFTLNLDGGIYRNNYMDLSKENPFVMPYTGFGYSEKKIGFSFGLESSISQKINFSVNFNYSNWKDAVLFVNDTTNLLMNKFSVVQEDYDLMVLSTAISYQHQDHILITLDGKYNIYNMQTGISPWHKPIYEIGLRAKYNIQDMFLITADVVAYGNSFARGYDSLNNEIEIALKPWVDVNLGAEYRISKKLGAFLNVNNIVATKYQRWYNYPTYGFSIMAGVNYIF